MTKLFLFINFLCMCAFLSGAQLSPQLRLFLAVDTNSIRTAQDLIDNGADVNEQGGANTLLMIAVRKGNVEMAKLLLDHGANINAINDNNETALDLAVVHNNEKLVFLLLERGANRSLGRLKDWKNVPKIIKKIFYKYDNREKIQERYNREKVEPCIVKNIEEVTFPPELAGEVAEYADIEAPAEEYDNAHQEEEKKSSTSQ